MSCKYQFYCCEPNALKRLNGSLDPPSGTVKMEVETQSFRGMIHYTIAGTLDGNRIGGTWVHGVRRRDSTLTRFE